MSVKRGGWIDHPEHGDRHERGSVGDVADLWHFVEGEGDRVSAMLHG
jgi:hypothetical protein